MTVKSPSVARILLAHPRRTLAVVPLMALAGAAEGFGLLTLLPILEAVSTRATGPSAAAGATPTPGARAILAFLAALHLPATIPVLLLAAFLALCAKAAFRWLAMATVAATVAGVAADLRLGLVRALLGARWRHFQAESTGAVAAAVSRDALWAAFAYRDACALLAAAIQLAVYAIAVLLVSWKLGLIALAAAALAGLPLAPWVRASRRAGHSLTRHGSALVARLVDALHAMKPIKAMAREQSFYALLERETDALRAAERRYIRASETLRALQEPLLAAVVLGAFFLATSSGRLPVASLLLLLVLFQRMASRWQVVQAEHQAVAGALGAVAALQARILGAELQHEPALGRDAPPLAHALRVAGVHCAHGRQQVLAGAALEVPAGAFVAITGRSGAGKTTLLDLIAGLREPDAGDVLVDGVSLREIAPGSWRTLLGYVPQESVLLSDSVRANVTLGRTDVSTEDTEGALRDAGASALVKSLPQGLETNVGEWGSRLSGGERRRVALARALVGKPRLLLLDEATNELDDVSAAAIGHTLRALRGRLTILAVTHHPELAAMADEVYVLEGGKLLPRDVAVAQVAS